MGERRLLNDSVTAAHRPVKLTKPARVWHCCFASFFALIFRLQNQVKKNFI